MTKRHTEAEIMALLDQAQEMAAQGTLQGDIAKILGVSVMTYHRWRRARAPNHSDAAAVEIDRADAAIARNQRKPVGELYLENSRLRRLVTDLLLEKMKLEESLRGGGAIHRIHRMVTPV
jgi:hypothetical protein